MERSGAFEFLPKKEVLKLRHEKDKLERNLSGIQDMERVPEAVYVIGNAPSALEAVCAAVRDKRARPSLLLAMPVGFVGATESKEALIADARAPFITIKGRKGGSAMAAAALNAIASEAE